MKPDPENLHDMRSHPPIPRRSPVLPSLLLLILGLLPLMRPVVAQSTNVSRSLTFEGNGQYVTVPHGPELNAYPFTVAFWLRTTQATGIIGLTTKFLPGDGNGWDVILNQGFIRTRFFHSWGNSLWTGDGMEGRPNGGFVADGRWHHIAYTVNVSGGTLYVDGEIRDQLVWSGKPGAPTNPMDLILGGTCADRTATVDGNFVGNLDDVGIWSRALDSA